MSNYSFKATPSPTYAKAGSLNSAFSNWLLVNHGAAYRAARREHLSRPNAQQFSAEIAACSPTAPTAEPLVGIVGGGFAGLFSGLILQSLGIGCEVFESSDRVGGRISTWYSSNYSPDVPEQAGLYGEVGGMRLPQFSQDMLPVQQLSIAVNAVLDQSGMAAQKVNWRKFYYDSPVQRLRYNNMASFTTLERSTLESFNFGEDKGGDVPLVWVTPKLDAKGQSYLPINKILEQVNAPFVSAIRKSFADGFSLMMQYDQYSMWDYLTTVFKLGDMQGFYDPAMGAKGELLPWAVANYLQTTNVGTGMYSVSFVELVIQVYDWSGSINPYRPADTGIYMLTVDQGMQRFPDACRAVLDLEVGVSPAQGLLAQMQVGMVPRVPGGPYSYTAPNLTRDAQFDASTGDVPATAVGATEPSALPVQKKQRVFLGHTVLAMNHDALLYSGHGGMKVKIRRVGNGSNAATAVPDEVIEKTYPYVISTLPNGAYLNGEFGMNLLNSISFAKAQAIRECNYMPAFKAFLTFKTQFWAKLGQRQGKGLGAAATDRPNRQIIYPSYGYDANQGVLQVYCWADDALKLGALGDKARVAECLKGIQYLYPDVDVSAQFAGYNDGTTTKTWFWDQHAGGGAFALFSPGQFKNLYATLLTPEFGGCLGIAGESSSVHHGWILGALDSAYNAVFHILQQAGATDKIRQMKETWGAFAPPDVSASAATDSVLNYGYAYNAVDRKAASVAPKATSSIYGNSQFEFKGNVPAFVADFSKVPQAMNATARDKAVLQMLNNQWDDNVAQRKKAIAKAQERPQPQPQSAVELLESIYLGHNFQTIPVPRFWLKDDAEFARQQLAGFMPTLLTRVDLSQAKQLIHDMALPKGQGLESLGPLGNPERIAYVADYRRFLEVCTVTPLGFCLAKPIVLFSVNANNELMPLGIQLDTGGELFTPSMPNAANAWLLAKMLTNCAGQTLHDVGFHQLLTHQLGALVSVALFSEEVFNPVTLPRSAQAFQQHPVFKLLRPHVVKTAEFQQTVYNPGYDPYLKPFPATRVSNGSPGVYNLGFVYDLIFSCGRIGNYQLQDHMYNDDGKFRFLDMAIPKDAVKRGVADTPFSYAYVHDTQLWYQAIARFVAEFVDATYPGGDVTVVADIQLQRFFAKLIPAFNYVDGARQANRFPAKVTDKALLKEVLAMFIWQFSVQHTVINDGAYNQAAFVPNASTLMYPPPAGKASKDWTPADVLACLPSQTAGIAALGGMTFMDIQINASVTGQGPYPETILGRGVLEPSIDSLQDTYGFSQPGLRAVVDNFYQAARSVGDAITLRQSRDIARFLEVNPASQFIPETVRFNLVEPLRVMNSIQT